MLFAEAMDPLSQVPELSDDYPSGNNPANSPPINYEWNEIPNVYKSVNKDGKYTKYELLSYVTNYYATLNPRSNTEEYLEESRKASLDALKKYYQQTALKALATRKGSCISETSSFQTGSSYRKSSLFHTFPPWGVDQPPHEEQRSNKSYSIDTNVDFLTSETAKIYSKYLQKCSLNSDPYGSDKEHYENMWVPISKWDPYHNKNEEPHLYTSYKIRLDIPFSDTSPISVTKLYPPIFSETKVPGLVYHSIVKLEGMLFVFGGMSPCYPYSDVAPDLSSFYVDGIKNLPPPLDESIINNPAMIPSKKLYTFSYASTKWRECEVSGQIPPPLVCVQGSLLTDRHIFYYGGFEIKNEVIIDPKTNEYFIKKRAVLNDTAYILDTLCYKFTKVELVPQPTKYVKYPTTVPRFGHLQVSLKTYPNKLSKGPTTGTEFTPSSASISSTEKSTGNGTFEDPIMNLVSSSMTLNSDNIISPTSSNTPGVYSILIMGGYCDGKDGTFEPISDLWKVEITILSRGKRNFIRFAETALTTLISTLPQDTVDETLKSEFYKKWPLPRGFMAYYVTDTDSLVKKKMDEDLLENMMHNFKIIDKNTEIPVKSDSVIPGRNTKVKTVPKLLNKSLIIHGGSANSFIHGDMWCYDLDEGSWTKMTLNSENQETGEIKPVDFPLTGHSFVHHKQMTVVVGGMNQKDIDNSSSWKNLEKAYSHEYETHDTNGTFTLISLPSRIIRNFEVDTLRDGYQNKQVDNIILSALRLSYNPIIYDKDYIWTVGGLIRDTDSSKVFLRGAISLVSLPLIDIPGV